MDQKVYGILHLLKFPDEDVMVLIYLVILFLLLNNKFLHLLWKSNGNKNTCDDKIEISPLREIRNV